MSLSPQKALLDHYWSMLEARPVFTAYVLPGNRINSASASAPNRNASRLAANDAKNFRLFATGGTSDKPPVTFADGADYGVPMRIDIEFRLISEKNADADIMPVEAEIELVIQSAGKSMRDAGMKWVGVITHRKSRAVKRIRDQGDQLRTEIVWTVSHQCRPLRSLLTT